MSHLSPLVVRLRSTLACTRLDRARVRNPGLLIALIALTLILATSVAIAQGPKGTGQPRTLGALLGTGFTYQGLLKDSGNPVNGVTCNFQFSLYDSLNGPTQIGATQTTFATVTNGYFTVGNLDFGSGALNGEARWLDIQVRCPAWSGSYTALTPRQSLTPAPMALALPGLYTQQNTSSPNLIGGYTGNSVTNGVKGATIGGGGEIDYTNRVTDDYGSVGGGRYNWAGDDAGTTNDKPHATVGGGYMNRAAETYATVGGGAGNYARGDSATVGGGLQNTASSAYATVSGGGANRATNQYATVPGGYGAVASHYGEMAYASGSLAGRTGSAQSSLYVVRNTTTDMTQTELFLDGSAQRITIASPRSVTFDILVVARTVGGSSAGYRIFGIIENQSGTTAFIGTPTVTTLGEDVGAWDVAVVADNGNSALVVKVTGTTATLINWVASVHTVEVSF